MRLLILLMTLLILISCHPDDQIQPTDSNLLIGTWRDTTDAQPQGYYVYELVFRPDSVFTARTSAFGVYAGHPADELSAWFEYEGDYIQNIDSLSFLSHQSTSWDSFFGGQPETKIRDKILFDDCRFAIQVDTLELNYITSPADHPVQTQQRYIKAE